MAEASTVKPPTKRRRILDPSAIVPVPIYSNQVNRNLQLKAPTFSDEKPAADDGFWSKFSCDITKQRTVELSDSDEEAEPERAAPAVVSIIDPLRSPSPPPESPVQKQSRKATLKLKEIERRLKAVNSLQSRGEQSRRRRGRRSPRLQSADSDVIITSPAEDDDLIIVSPDVSFSASSPPGLRAEREIPLKVRCRADLHRILVNPSTPLSVVAEQLSVTLGVPPTRLLLLHEEAELRPDATVRALGLGIADIIECVVMADEAEKDVAEAGDDVIKVRLQSKDRAAAQEFSLHRDAPLGSVFAQYLSALTGGARKKVCFHFDGSKVSPQQTPAQLDMEDGDIIEVWA